MFFGFANNCFRGINKNFPVVTVELILMMMAESSGVAIKTFPLLAVDKASRLMRGLAQSASILTSSAESIKALESLFELLIFKFN